MRKDRLVIKGKPTGTAKDDIVLKHLINKQKGEPIPYFIDEEDGRLKYLDKKTTNKKTGVITYGYNDLTKKLEREARYTANKLKLTPSLELFKQVFGKVKGEQIFLDEVAKSDAIFNANDPDLYDIDHMGSKKFKYPHMARNFNPQEAAANRAEGARLLTKEQEVAFRILRNDLKTTIQLQGPEMTQVQKDQVMQRKSGGITKNLIKSTVVGTVANSLLNPGTARAVGAMGQHGVNKETMGQFGIAVGNDIQAQLVFQGLVKTLEATGGPINGNGAIGAVGDVFKPAMVGWLGYNMVDSFAQGLTNGNLQDIGIESENSRQDLMKHGNGNGKSAKQNWRHGTANGTNGKEQLNELRDIFTVHEEDHDYGNGFTETVIDGNYKEDKKKTINRRGLFKSPTNKLKTA